MYFQTQSKCADGGVFVAVRDLDDSALDALRLTWGTFVPHDGAEWQWNRRTGGNRRGGSGFHLGVVDDEIEGFHSGGR